MVKYSCLAILLFSSVFLSSQELHSNWDSLLKKYVNSKGEVNYQLWVNNQAGINDYLETLYSHDLNFDSNEAEKAFWMNLYNAATIQMVLKKYPVNSIKQIENGEIWDLKWIKMKGNTLSLNQIENEKIRRKFKDARIHFGINCAAISCPKLNNKAFTSLNLEIELDRLTSEFINDKSKITSKSISISKIFEWYKADFTENGTIQEYLNKYLIKKVPTGFQIEYSDYNWSLNKQKE